MSNQVAPVVEDIAPGRRYAIYTRSATGDDGALSEQVQIARDFLRRWRVAIDAIPVYADACRSGLDRQRPGLLALLRDVANGRVDAVVVRDLARLARGEELPDLLGALDRWGVDVLVATMAEAANDETAVPGKAP